MPRPSRGPSERLLMYRESLRNPTKPADEKPYFQQNYADVFKLLDEKMLNYIRLNPRLRDNLRSRRRFIANTETMVVFNFIEFSERYRAKFIDKDFEGYCLKFMEQFYPLLLDFLKEVQFGGHDFRFRFRYNEKVFEKGKTILVILDDHDSAIK